MEAGAAWKPRSLDCDRRLPGTFGFWQLLGDERADCFSVWLIWGYAWKGMRNRHQGEHLEEKAGSIKSPGEQTGISITTWLEGREGRSSSQPSLHGRAGPRTWGLRS